MNTDLARQVTEFGRLTHRHPDLGHDEYTGDRHTKLPPVPLAEANVASSLLTHGKHAPAIDIDLPVHVVQSSTPGHSHSVPTPNGGTRWYPSTVTRLYAAEQRKAVA